MNLSSKIIDRLTSALIGIPELEAAYLFGSSAQYTGKEKEPDDIDIAIITKNKVSLDVLSKVLELSQGLLKTDKIDVCILNDASPILAFEVIRGKRLFTSSVSAVASFESLAARRYEDEMARILKCRRLAAERLGRKRK